MTAAGLLSIPLGEMLDLWAEIREADLGVNGYGGDVAELYAYRFVGRSPSAEMDVPDGRELQSLEAADALLALCREYELRRECMVEIETPNGWRRCGGWLAEGGFDHRVHVRVRR